MDRETPVGDYLKGGITVNLAETRIVTKILVTETNWATLLFGHGGIGKSETVYQMVAEMAQDYGEPVGLSEQRIGQEETGDITGLPRASERNVTTFTLNPLFPAQGEIGQHREALAIAYPDGHWEYGGLMPRRGVWFLDEVNRGEPATIQALYQVLLTRTLHEHRLAPDWKIVLAGNPPTNDYYVTSLDDAFLSRVVQLWVTNTVDQWALHARDRQVNEDLIGFLRAQPQMLDGHKDTYQVPAKPSPRGWMIVAELLKTSLRHQPTDLVTEVLTGIVGPEAATAAMLFIAEENRQRHPVSATEILTAYPEHRARFLEIVQSQRSDLRDATVDDVLTTLAEKEGVADANPDYVGLWFKDLLEHAVDVAFGAIERLIHVPMSQVETSLLWQSLFSEDHNTDLFDRFMARKSEMDAFRTQVQEATVHVAQSPS